jgi:hypothetical protein
MTLHKLTTINDLLTQVREAQDSIEFAGVMQVINQFYTYTPTEFSNGPISNPAGTNEGSCKIFYFAQINKLTEIETLSLFGRYYRDDVLANPTGTDHSNIRNFLLSGWPGIKFDNSALAILVSI